MRKTRPLSLIVCMQETELMWTCSRRFHYTSIHTQGWDIHTQGWSVLVTDVLDIFCGHPFNHYDLLYDISYRPYFLLWVLHYLCYNIDTSASQGLAWYHIWGSFVLVGPPLYASGRPNAEWQNRQNLAWSPMLSLMPDKSISKGSLGSLVWCRNCIMLFHLPHWYTFWTFQLAETVLK